MYKGINVQANFGTYDTLLVLPLVDTVGSSFCECRNIGPIHFDYKSFHIWGECGKRLERILEPVRFPEVYVEGHQGGRAICDRCLV